MLGMDGGQTLLAIVALVVGLVFIGLGSVEAIAKARQAESAAKVEVAKSEERWRIAISGKLPPGEADDGAVRP